MEESFSAAAFLKGEAMERILTACQMQQADRETAADGLPAMVLMERGGSVRRGRPGRHRVGIWTGFWWFAERETTGATGRPRPGFWRNGDIKFLFIWRETPEKYSEQMRSQLKIAEKYPVTFVNSFEKGEYTVIIDAVFGVGLSRPVRGIFAETVEQINRSGSKVLAIDIHLRR